MAWRPLIATLALAPMVFPIALAFAQGTAPTGTANAGSLGTILVDQNGMTLYTLSADQPGVSTCTGGCANAWPPALVDAATAATLPPDGHLGTLARSDGTGLELTWDGMPLYRFVRDTAPGDVNGNGVNAFGGTWLVVPAEIGRAHV